MDVPEHGMAPPPESGGVTPGGIPGPLAGPRRRWLWITLLILGGLLLLRETGKLDANLYIRSSNSGWMASKVSQLDSSIKQVNYEISFQGGKKEFLSRSVYHGGVPTIRVVAEIGEPEYRGNTWLPLYKKFSMKYSCPFKTVAGPANCKVEGKIEGHVDARIIGLCSRTKARQLAFDEAKKSIQDYVSKELK